MCFKKPKNFVNQKVLPNFAPLFAKKAELTSIH